MNDEPNEKPTLTRFQVALFVWVSVVAVAVSIAVLISIRLQTGIAMNEPIVPFAPTVPTMAHSTPSTVISEALL